MRKYTLGKNEVSTNAQIGTALPIGQYGIRRLFDRTQASSLSDGSWKDKTLEHTTEMEM